jgi:hypothetical protein
MIPKFTELVPEAQLQYRQRFCFRHWNNVID